MNIVKVFLFSLFFTSIAASANNCGSPSPGKINGTLKSQVNAEPLTSRNREKIVSLLNRINQKREGEASGYFCKNGKEKVYVSSDDVKMTANKRSKDSYKMKISFKTSGSHGIPTEHLNYSIGNDRLYSSLNRTGYQTIIKKLSNKEMIVLEKQRFNKIMTRETIRHYKLGRKLVIKSTYYINGSLHGENTWVLES